MLAYPSTISLSTRSLTCLADLIRHHRARIRSRWRRLDPGRQALLALAWLRNGDTYQRLAAGFGVGVGTVYRYLREAVDLLAAQAPTLAQAIERAALLVWVILDGTLVPIERVADQRPYYSGKHKRHGVNVQILAGPRGHLLWASPALPGSTHDLTAARTHALIDALAHANVIVWADKGYQGARGTVSTPFKGRNLPEPMREVNRAHARVRAKGERAVAILKTWKVLSRLRCDPARATTITRAIVALQHVEDPY
ncbi:transposase family protein [Luedemannella helvata]|uniref:Transposase family protein n=1 Tax=Luedemannella helvata TaxID=349315 RepID=A0ABN2L3U9_9ACTN